MNQFLAHYIDFGKELPTANTVIGTFLVDAPVMRHNLIHGFLENKSGASIVLTPESGANWESETAGDWTGLTISKANNGGTLATGATLTVLAGGIVDFVLSAFTPATKIYVRFSVGSGDSYGRLGLTSLNGGIKLMPRPL